MLIQVSKEERGNKGAAVTTYLSLPGRYCVLMPNSPHAGGISRKIANFKDRRYMKEILSELNAPEGMSVILRTAGVARTKAEIKRDFDYLIRLWDEIRELTLRSSAPSLINEEGNLVKRSIRDIYTRDIEEVIVAGAEGYKNAKKFMKLLIPSHAKKVQEYKDERLPLFQRYQVETQINEIAEPSVTLKSGGYIVINPTEALVSIDVNSGRATKERHIEETALKTNLEAADEVARQLKLRDLGGLVVIDFIDMEDRRNNIKVERRIKDALSKDRARIQIGRISSFGLLELSRQRMNPSLTESQFHRCPHCQGVGFIRTLDGTAISALRAVEEMGTHGRHSEIVLKIQNDVALYILNNKRSILASIEQRYNLKVIVEIDNTVHPGKFIVEPGAVKIDDPVHEELHEIEDSSEEKARSVKVEDDEEEKPGDQRKGSRRRGRRGGRRRNRQDDVLHEFKKDINEEPVDQEDHQALTEESQKSEEQEKPESKSGRKKPGRKPRKQKEKETGKDSSKQEKQTEEKKTPRRGRKPKKDEKPDAKSSSAAEPQSKPEPEIREQPVVEKPDSVVQSSPRRSADYEIVSQPTENKKKGWWNKLIEQ
jgi:ribonuclease E